MSHRLFQKWEITSIIPLVGRFCPSDTMRLWKSGNHIRVDFRKANQIF